MSSKEHLEIFDWLAPYVERVAPKSTDPKKPKAWIAAKAARLAFHTQPGDTPRKFVDGVPYFNSQWAKRTPQQATEAVAMIIHNIEKFLTDHFKEFVDFVAAEYDVLFIHQDGDNSSRGYRIAHANERKAVESQNAWGIKHDDGAVESNDALAAQSQRLFPRATIERYRLTKR